MSEQNVPPLTSPTTPRRLSERRAFVRHPCNHNSFCHSVQSGDRNCWPATFSDVSIGGLSLRVGRPFQEGEVLVLELEHPIADLRVRLFAKAMYATAKPGGVWVVGCRFINRLTDYELEALR